MTLDVGTGIADRAERYIIKYVTLIPGEPHGVKVHKLMCHVMDTIRMHGNIFNGNAVVNEDLHKDDKANYARMSSYIDAFMALLVVQAQGSRSLLQRIAGEEEPEAETNGMDGDNGEPAAADGVGGEEGTGRRADDSDESDDKVEASLGSRPTRYYRLPLVGPSRPVLRPGLAGVEAGLGRDSDAQARVASRGPFEARFDDGTTAPQVLFASQSSRDSSWCDTVLYAPTEDDTQVSVEELRAIVRQPGEDVAVVGDMEGVAPLPRCPWFPAAVRS